MLEKKELNSIPRKFPSEQQLYDLNTKGRFCILPDVPVDAADKVIPSHTSTSSQGGMFGQSLDGDAENSSSSTSTGSNPNTLFSSKPENKGWKWGDSIEPSQELIDHYAEQKPTRGVTTLSSEDFSFK